jgi:predicted phage terminase large subunit-like protein
VDGKIYLLDKVREKFEAPELRREAEMFYNKHNTPRINVTDPVLRAMYIEDKSSGTGLIQELRRKHLKIKEVPRVVDKYLRGEDAAPYVELGNVVLNTSIPGVGNLTKEAREFPNGDFDDDIDTCMTAIEVTYINKDKSSMLKAAMEAD